MRGTRWGFRAAQGTGTVRGARGARGARAAALALTGALLVAATGCSTPQADEAARSSGSTGADEGAVPDDSAVTDDSTVTDGSAVTDDSAVTQGPAEGAEGLPAAVDLSVLDGALGEQTRWVLGLLAPGASGPSADEAEQHFHPDFLAQVPAEQLEPVFAELRAAGQMTVTSVEAPQDGPDGQRSSVLDLSGEEPLRISIVVDGEGLITGLRFQPGPPADLPEVSSWEGLESQFADLGGTTRLYVGQVADGACTTTYGADAEPAPSGSVFKLIVLSAVVDAVAAGDLGWEDDLRITAEAKSLPSGELQNRPDGETVSVGEAASLMISISDNTATDLLMDAVGEQRLREAVERISDDPDRLTPLPTTGQFFELGWDAPQLREQWAQADDPQQRSQILDELTGDLSGLAANPFAVSDPAWPDGVGWFLTGQEICTAHAVLQQQAETAAGEPVRQILSGNPGLPIPEGVSYQGFKGGSAPGVLAYTFYVEGPDGKGQVLSVQVSNERQILPTSFTELTQAGLAHLVDG